MLAKSKLNSIEILLSKALIDSVVSHDEFVLINNVIKEYDEMKEEIKNLFKDLNSLSPKKSKFIKQQEAAGLLSSLEITTS